MEKFFNYLNKISIILLIYLLGFLTFKFDFVSKNWLNSSINLFIEELSDKPKNFLLNGLRSLSEDKNSEEFQYFLKKNIKPEKKNLLNKDFNSFMLLSLSKNNFNESNFGLYSSPTKKVHSWNFENTIKPTVLLNIFKDGKALIYNDEYISLISSDSKEIWKTKKIVHHWGSIFQNKIYMPGRKYANYPEDLDDNSKKIKIGKCKVDNALVDTIVIIDVLTGKILDEIEVLPIISSHPYLSKKLGYSKKIFSRLKTNNDLFESIFLGPSYCDDLLHLNDIKIITSEDKKFFDNANEGDYLLSLHTINALVLIDNKSLQVKWYLRDEFRRQHSPNISKNGMLLIFDNEGSDEKFGESRIVQFDLKKNKFNPDFDGNENFFFESDIRGRIQIFNDQIYVTSSQQGEVFKLNCVNENLKRCEPQILFSSNTEGKSNSIFVADFYNKDFFTKDFLTKINE